MIDYFALGNVVIDDIVLADGRAMLDVLGGASAHALAGLGVWGGRLGVVAVVGADFPAHHRAALAALAGLGVDLTGLIERPGTPTPRAWQRILADDRREIEFRTSAEDFIRDSPAFGAIPASYLAARGTHLYWSPTLAEDPDLLARLRTANPALRLVWEPSWLWASSPPGALQAACPLADLVTPDEEMALAMTGTTTAEAALATLLAWGAPLVAIRQGAAGSLLGDAAGGLWRIPAVPVAVVDVTGAGNAYGGGCLVGLGRGLPPVEAALLGAVSASFALEQFGLPRLGPDTAEQAAERLGWARQHVHRVPSSEFRVPSSEWWGGRR